VQQTIKVILPSVARGSKVEKDSFGNAEITYTTGQDFLSKAITVLGILLVLIGCWFYFRSYQKTGNALIQPSVTPIKTELTEEEKIRGLGYEAERN
jgi:hypothetical protein